MSTNPIGLIANAAIELFNRAWPDPVKQAEAAFKIRELEQKGDSEKLLSEVNLMLGQTEVNKVQASHASILVAGARPAVMWIGAFGLAYASFLEPFMRFVATVGFGYVGSFPVVNADITLQVLFGVLGLGLYRTYEKKHGVQTDAIR